MKDGLSNDPIHTQKARDSLDLQCIKINLNGSDNQIMRQRVGPFDGAYEETPYIEHEAYSSQRYIC